MGYFLYKLDFTTALHIGSDNSGSSQFTQMTFIRILVSAYLSGRKKVDGSMVHSAKGQCAQRAYPIIGE